MLVLAASSAAGVLSLLSGPIFRTNRSLRFVEIQSLLDLGKLSDAESAAHRYLESTIAPRTRTTFWGTFSSGAKSQILISGIHRGGTLSGSQRARSGSHRLRLLPAWKTTPPPDEWLTKSVELDPDDAQAQYYLGTRQVQREALRGGRPAFTECLKLNPKNIKAADNLGLSYEALGKTEDALASYRTAIALDAGAAAGNAGPYLNLGTLLVENDRPSEAVPYLLQVVRIARRLTRGLTASWAKAYLLLNRLEEAQTELENAVALAPENAPIHFLLAQVYRKRGLADKAHAWKPNAISR